MTANTGLHGFLVVDKPPGFTSHDVVAKLRRASGRAKVGHAGTLDPMATGVLVLCVGVATRLTEYVIDHPKRYRAEVTLGIETDSYDAAGRVVREDTVPQDLTSASVEAALALFRGAIEQRPPAFSAVQVDGQRLYDLARRGRDVDVPLRAVTVHELSLLALDSPRLTLEVACSKGTYVRSLAHDLGRALGCGAHLSELRRLASGPFAIEDAVALNRAAAELAAGRGSALMRPLALAVSDLLKVWPGVDGVAELRLGRPWAPPNGSESRPTGTRGRAHDDAGELVAIVTWRADAWWPAKVLVQ